MTNEEQSVLWQQYADTRDNALRDRLVEAYLPLSRHIAIKFINRGLEKDDLEQIAAMALLKAVERFQPEKGFRFVTYAVPEITGAIRHALRDQNGTFRLSRDVTKLLTAIAKEQNAFEQKHFRSPTAQELAECIGVSAQDIVSALYMQSSVQTVSMDQKINQNEDIAFSELLGVEEERFAEISGQQRYQWALQQANPQEKLLMQYRFREALNQRETAQRMGISQMQVSRLERRFLSRLLQLIRES